MFQMFLVVRLQVLWVHLSRGCISHAGASFTRLHFSRRCIFLEVSYLTGKHTTWGHHADFVNTGSQVTRAKTAKIVFAKDSDPFVIDCCKKFRGGNSRGTAHLNLTLLLEHNIA